ncbi:hypothetical protein F511_10850 [Dorcoceras hygrometricum]|uniref:Triacylglycerol lipase n=1 Tax=Dorcoceras hygrometricum TaxID=472368 RepID=A0A2Z7AMI5_9LAMI|nr:hypothetical protein F511_10850 [Dorcoceras hygrometricum]
MLRLVPAARICSRVCRLVVQLGANVNDGQLYCSLRLVSCSLRLVVLRENQRLDDGVHRIVTLLASRRLAPTSFTRKPALQTVGGDTSSIRSTTGNKLPTSICTRRSDRFWHERKLLVAVIETSPITRRTDGGGAAVGGGRIQLAVGPQPLWLRNHNFGLAHQIMVKRLATSPHDTLGITYSACKNQSVMVSVQYGPFNTYIPIRSTTIGKSRVARDPITMHSSRRSNSDMACVTRVSMMFRVVRTNQYNQDLGLIHSTNGNHLESPNEGSLIDHQVTIRLHAQNITMFPTNETWYFTSQMLVSSSGGLILILTAQSTRNEFRIHSDY